MAEITYLYRLHTEAEQLGGKIEKLNMFIQSENFDKLNSEQKWLMHQQMTCMSMYSNILHKRIMVEYDLRRDESTATE